MSFPDCSTHLCKSICLFDPSSFCCFDILLFTESADELVSAALFLPLPAPPPAGAAAPSLSDAAGAAAADFGGRPRRLTGDASVSAFGGAFWLGSTWQRVEGSTVSYTKTECVTLAAVCLSWASSPFWLHRSWWPGSRYFPASGPLMTLLHHCCWYKTHLNIHQMNSASSWVCVCERVNVATCSCWWLRSSVGRSCCLHCWLSLTWWWSLGRPFSLVPSEVCSQLLTLELSLAKQRKMVELLDWLTGKIPIKCV